MFGILGVGFDPIPAGRVSFDGAATGQTTPRSLRKRANP
jgi:hypothetical protein